jgi:hypothetical protein
VYRQPWNYPFETLRSGIQVIFGEIAHREVKKRKSAEANAQKSALLPAQICGVIFRLQHAEKYVIGGMRHDQNEEYT